MNVAELLKTTPRGSLKYDRSPPSKEFLDKCSSIPELPRFCSETVKKEVIEKSEENVKDNQQEKETCKNESPQRNIPQPKNHTKLVVSPEFGRSVQAIKNYEQILDERAKNKKLEKEKEFKIHSKKLEEEALRKMKEVEQRKIIQAKNTHEKVVRQHQQGMVEMQEKVNKLKEDHRQHKEMIEKRKAKLQEELRQKERERSERMDAIQKLLTEMVNVLQQLSAMYQGCQHKDKLPDKAKQAIDLVQHRVSQGQQLMSQTLKTKDITAEVVDKLKEHLRICSNAFDFVKGQIAEVNKTAEAEAKAKAEAEALAKAQAEEQAKAKAAAEEAKRAQQEGPLATSTPMPSSGGQGATGQASVQQTSLQLADDEVQCVDIEAFNNYNRLQQEIKDVENSYKTLATNAQVKKLKFSFQKAVNTPINAISPVSGEHLRDKLQRLLALLQGHAVEISNKRTSVSEHPEALLFCKHLIARMIVKKGEEQVSSKHETAFAIAGVAVGVWCEHPDVGRFLIAEFHKVCPYIVPYHIPRQEGQSVEDYHKSLGYKFDDGKVEDQDKFLKRMSGVMRLYAALLVAVPPKGVNHPHPHGIENAWIWLSRVMNIEPLPDVTTTMVYDMLQVTGHALFKEYRKQFTKLLHILVKEYLPKLNHVATKAGSGPVSRLRTFLEDSIKNHGQIGPPEGLLPQNFWFS